MPVPAAFLMENYKNEKNIYLFLLEQYVMNVYIYFYRRWTKRVTV